MVSIARSVGIGILAGAVVSSAVLHLFWGQRRSLTSEGEAPSGTAAGGSATAERPVHRTVEAEPVQPGPLAETTHGRLVLDGHFAERVGLLAGLRAVPLPGKTVQHAPHEHLVTAFVNILAGHRQLQQVSRGQTPLRADRTLAAAWGQAAFPEVSGVSRLLHATTWATAAAVRTQLQAVFAPYVAHCQGRAVGRGERLVVDWDLMAKEITTDATSEPYAAYGHQEHGLGKGYQWAAAVLRGTGPDEQPRAVALGGFLRPGNAHPPECVGQLQEITEATLGRPRRRPDLLAVRVAAADAAVAQRQAQVAAQTALVARRAEQRRHLDAAVPPLATGGVDQPGQQERLARLQVRQARATRQEGISQARLAVREGALAAAVQMRTALRTRLAHLEAENGALDAAGQPGVRIEVVMDAQFGGSAEIAALLEDGYDVTTKATSPATMTALLRRQATGESVFDAWVPVSANAEVAECRLTTYATCPHPLRLLGYRKHLAASATRPAQTQHAVVLTSIGAAERPAVVTLAHYHQRGGTVELINRLVKSYLGFRGHRLRHAPGLDILGQLAFAAVNFVAWMADTVWATADQPRNDRPGLATLMEMARAPATILHDAGGVLVQFAVGSGWPQRTLCLGTLLQPPLPGFDWQGVPLSSYPLVPT